MMQMRRWVIKTEDTEEDSILLHLDAIPIRIEQSRVLRCEDGSNIYPIQGLPLNNTSKIIRNERVYHVTYMVPKGLEFVAGTVND